MLNKLTILYDSLIIECITPSTYSPYINYVPVTLSLATTDALIIFFCDTKSSLSAIQFMLAFLLKGGISRLPGTYSDVAAYK